MFSILLYSDSICSPALWLWLVCPETTEQLTISTHNVVNSENQKHFCDSHIDGLVWGRRGSSVFTLELFFFCIGPSMLLLTVSRRTLNRVMNCWYSTSVLLFLLTHWGQDEIGFICRQHVQMHFGNEIIRISVNSSLKIFFHSSPVHKKSSLVQVMTWHRAWTNDGLIY